MVLAVHILLAVPGVGLPLFIAVAHYLGLRRQDPDWLALSQRWTRLFAILFPIGALTGTLIAPVLALVWPPFMELVGQVGVLPMFIEGFAFFTEAIFLGLYLYGRDRIRNPWWHWATSLPLVLASAGSAFLITTVNAWMQTPAGFRLEGGRVVNANPWQAMFNASTGITTAHVLITAYLTVAFLLVGWTAWGMWKRSLTHGYSLERKGLALLLSAGFVFALATVFTGDLSAQLVAREQPAKLAAMEALFQTQAHAPLTIGGWPDAAHQRVIGGLPIPSLLSWLAFRNGAAIVKGLNDFPRDFWPPLVVHLTFDLMVGIGFLLLLIPVLYHVAIRRLRAGTAAAAASAPVSTSPPTASATPSTPSQTSAAQPQPWPLAGWLARPWFIWMLIVSSPLAFLAIQAGWFTTELGRQPWIIYEMMTVAAALTKGSFLPTLFWALFGLYVVIAGVTVVLLRRVLGRHSLEDDWLQALNQLPPRLAPAATVTSPVGGTNAAVTSGPGV